MACIQSKLARSIFVLVLVTEIPFNFSHYRYRFSMPQLEWPMALNRMWYSFDIARVHFIGLVVCYTGLPLGAEHLNFEGGGDLVKARSAPHPLKN